MHASTWGPHGAPPRTGTLRDRKISPGPSSLQKIGPPLYPIISIQDPQVWQCTIHSDGCVVDPTIEYIQMGAKLGIQMKFGVCECVVHSDGQSGGSYRARGTSDKFFFFNFSFFLVNEFTSKSFFFSHNEWIGLFHMNSFFSLYFESYNADWP